MPEEGPTRTASGEVPREGRTRGASDQDHRGLREQVTTAPVPPGDTLVASCSHHQQQGRCFMITRKEHKLAVYLMLFHTYIRKYKNGLDIPINTKMILIFTDKFV